MSTIAAFPLPPSNQQKLFTPFKHLNSCCSFVWMSFVLFWFGWVEIDAQEGGHLRQQKLSIYRFCAYFSLTRYIKKSLFKYQTLKCKLQKPKFKTPEKDTFH